MLNDKKTNTVYNHLIIIKYQNMPENIPNLDTTPLEIKNAIAEIESIIGSCGVMGANDYEIPTLKKLQEDLRQGNINPEEATQQAHQILESKQGYH